MFNLPLPTKWKSDKNLPRNIEMCGKKQKKTITSSFIRYKL